MLRLEVMFLLLTVIVVLVACGGAAIPAASVRPDGKPTSVPATSVAPTREPTPSVEAETPTSIPTVALTLTPADVTSATGNPDLNFAQVIFVQATQGSNGLWRFDTTVRHNDEGWDHYADAWQVVDPDGKVLAERVLLHPHDTEQPFTRSQSNIDIPPEMTQVIVRAKCNVHGFGGQEVVVDLTATEGENYEIVRN